MGTEEAKKFAAYSDILTLPEHLISSDSLKYLKTLIMQEAEIRFGVSDFRKLIEYKSPISNEGYSFVD